MLRRRIFKRRSSFEFFLHSVVIRKLASFLSFPFILLEKKNGSEAILFVELGRIRGPFIVLPPRRLEASSFSGKRRCHLSQWKDSWSPGRGRRPQRRRRISSPSLTSLSSLEQGRLDFFELNFLPLAILLFVNLSCQSLPECELARTHAHCAGKSNKITHTLN